MGILLCEQNFRDVWIRNKSVRAEIGQILHTDTHTHTTHTHTHTHTHTTAAKLVVRIITELDAEVAHRVQSGWKNWKRVSGVLRDRENEHEADLPTVPLLAGQSSFFYQTSRVPLNHGNVPLFV